MKPFSDKAIFCKYDACLHAQRWPTTESLLQAEVLSLFTRDKVVKQLTEAERIGQEVGAIGGVLKAGSLTFLDQQRFNNIAIPLTRLGMDNKAIRDAVISMNTSVLTPRVVAILMDCAPTADDIEAISFYDGDPALLAQVCCFPPLHH